MAVARIQSIASHLSGKDPKAKLFVQSPDDVVVTVAKRTALCKARKGGYKDTSSNELLIETFKAARENIGIDPALIGDIVVGTVLTPGAPYAARAASLTAGFPDTVPVQIINRFCSSGLMAVQSVANQIRNGEIEIGLAVGFEDMTNNPDEGASGFAQETLDTPVGRDCTMPMGWTSENVAGEFNISRESMDAWAALSMQRAEAAQKAGIFDKEVAPVTVPQKQADGSVARVVVSRDDGIRYGTTEQGLAKIKGAFKQWPPSQTTGGNASQITDGGAFVLLMTRRKAQELHLPILAKHIATVTAGLAPRIMGIGPSVAIPKLLGQAGITADDVDLYEINEAFASMMVYCVQKLALDPKKVNVNGGSIALGHPLGATGARQVATILNAAKQLDDKPKVLVTSMCIGLGMGAAALWTSE